MLVAFNFPGKLMVGFGGAETIDHVDSSGEQHAVAPQTGGMA
jgi:hypothetical protein